MAEENRLGRPPRYARKYCAMLVDHMSRGGGAESFAGKIGITKQSFYRWVEEHEEFSDAFERGQVKAFEFYENIGVQGITGRLRRVTRETPMLDAAGKQVYGRDGKPVTIKEYEYVRIDSATYRLFMRNKFGWKGDMQQGDDGEDRQADFAALARAAEAEAKKKESGQ
jgi:hypothetical protein